MQSNLPQMAVMNIEEGEEILAGRATARIPQVGIYKLLAIVSTLGQALQEIHHSANKKRPLIYL